ncbi:MAG: HAD family hydrolase [bacterium]|nr:HAD family hydrolase [bacterium]
MIRGIVFDLFDTLVDQNHDRFAPVEVEGRRVGATTPGLYALAVKTFGLSLGLTEFAERLRTVDLELRADTVDQGIELSTLDRFTALGTRLGQRDVLAFGQALTEVHMGALREAVTVPPHHEAILASLAVEHRLGICSNFTHAETARAILREAAFEPHFSSIVISEEMGIRKPRMEIFESVVRSLEMPASEILHVGDDLRADVQGAAEIGLRTVWLTRQIADPQAAAAAYNGPQPDFALEDLMDLPVLAARLNA